jgi:hypothetical protein
MHYYIEEGGHVQQLEIQARELQKLRVGDLVRYDPLESYLIDNDDALGRLGIVVDMNPAMMDICVVIGDRRFWCSLGDLEAVRG